MYRLINENEEAIQRISDGAFIPRVPENRDYAAFLKWEEEGGVIEPPLETPINPQQAQRDEAKDILKDAESTTEEKLAAIVKLMDLDK